MPTDIRDGGDARAGAGRRAAVPRSAFRVAALVLAALGARSSPPARCGRLARPSAGRPPAAPGRGVGPRRAAGGRRRLGALATPVRRGELDADRRRRGPPRCARRRRHRRRRVRQSAARPWRRCPRAGRRRRPAGARARPAVTAHDTPRPSAGDRGAAGSALGGRAGRLERLREACAGADRLRSTPSRAGRVGACSTSWQGPRRRARSRTRAPLVAARPVEPPRPAWLRGL